MKYLEILAGTSLHQAIIGAKSSAQLIGEDCVINFEGIPLVVSEHSYYRDVALIYSLECELRRLKEEAK